MAMPLVRCRRHALCKKAKGAPLLHWVQFRRTSNSKSKSISSGSLLCYCSFSCFTPLAPPRTCRGISSISGTGAFGIGGGIGTMYFDDIGRSGFAVGCLPAPLRSGPAQKTAGLPSSPPNAREPVPLSVLYPRSTWGGFVMPFGRSIPTCRVRPQVHFPESATEKPRRHVRCRSGGHSAALRDRLQVHYRGTPRKSPHAMCGGDRRSPKSRGAPRRQPFHFGQTSNKGDRIFKDTVY